MNAVLPALAAEDLLYHFESHGYWVKMTDVRTFLSAVGPQLEMMRLLEPHKLVSNQSGAVPASTEIVGNVLIAQGAIVGEDCKLGPDVVIGCVAARRAPRPPRACHHRSSRTAPPHLTGPPPATTRHSTPRAGQTACSRTACASRRRRCSQA